MSGVSFRLSKECVFDFLIKVEMFEVFLFTRMILYLPSDILINALDLNTKVGEFYNAFNLKEKNSNEKHNDYQSTRIILAFIYNW